MKQIISLDLYSKVVLTVIAACLVALVLGLNLEPERAIAYERAAMNEPKYPKININLDQLAGEDLAPGAPIPVRIVK